VTRTGSSGNGQGSTFSDTASCPAGTVLLGGGAALTSGGGTYNQSLGRAVLIASYASAADTWTATMVIRQNFVPQSDVTVTAHAVCTA
jgi:hypothetical protein